ncbi:hypothetical protein GQX73_g8418 [Xylaria multiplex]|uniref:Uncharacterized protein n=1 Tax=Xylaria multiplex TaxID=323545 RepID=A0A7C8MLC1_9PEZI|nr:hypothetical protein GQX73_g8418 [Xylaria multiplex]
MAKKKNRKARADAPVARPAIVGEWGKYMGRGDLEDWQRLMRDLGFEEEFVSKTQCRKTLKAVWVNIHDFLDAVKKGEPVHHFESQDQLARYTIKNRLFYPKKNIEKGSPLRQLLAQIRRRQAMIDYEYTGLALEMGGLSITGHGI